MIHALIDHTDKILTAGTLKFDFAEPSTDPIQLSRDLAETLILNQGLGLAAPQIGIPVRAFAMMSEKIIVCFNPRIIDESDEVIVLEEGCLSYPELFVKVKRPRRIKVRYEEPNGETVTKTFDGITARVFQHELDHLNGICHIYKANKYHKEQALKKWKKLQKDKK
jgi:peptide deformylase